jgi:hypothetical protein
MYLKRSVCKQEVNLNKTAEKYIHQNVRAFFTSLHNCFPLLQNVSLRPRNVLHLQHGPGGQDVSEKQERQETYFNNLLIEGAIH